jgi:L-malate glycosyltransferase
LGRAGYLLSIGTLRRLARRLRPDVVHAQYVTSYGFLAAAAGLRPLVVTAWGTDVLISPGHSRLLRFFARFAVRRADAVTTVAAHMNSSVAALGVPLDAITTVPFGVDTRRFAPPPVPRAATVPLRLICTRNFAPVYSVETLLHALCLVAQRGPLVVVDLVGDGPLKSHLQAQVSRSGLDGAVCFHGHVDHGRLTQLLANAHVFVSPAVSDGNNVSLNEAMACGCLPIATAIPANTQWIEHGVNGLLYPPGDSAALADCIARAVTDAELRERAGQLNRAIVEARANWSICVARMTETYARAIEHAQARS